jgi:hypothetical protein
MGRLALGWVGKHGVGTTVERGRAGGEILVFCSPEPSQLGSWRQLNRALANPSQCPRPPVPTWTCYRCLDLGTSRCLSSTVGV